MSLGHRPPEYLFKPCSNAITVDHKYTIIDNDTHTESINTPVVLLSNVVRAESHA